MVENKEENYILQDIPVLLDTKKKDLSIGKFLMVFAYVVCMTILSWVINGRSLLGIDDANIYFVYMKNLAEGHGFVYNVGGERVEGFTSLLWTLIGAVFFYLSSAAEIILLMLNVVLVSIALFFVIRFIDQRCAKVSFPKSASFTEQIPFSNHSLLFLGMLAVIPGYFDWTILTLMETGLWSGLLIGLTLLLMEMTNGKETRTINVLFNFFLILIVVCRPESMLWGLFFIGARFLCQLILQHQSPLTATKKALLSILLFGGAVAALIGWRISYFGFPFPNTYYAKVSPDIFTNMYDGLKYWNQCIQNNPPILLAIFGFLYFFMIPKNRVRWRRHFYLMVAFSVCGITLLVPLLTGGDHFGYSRFLQPTLPIFYLLLVCLLYEFKLQFSKKALVFILAAISFLPVYSYYSTVLNWRNPIFFEWKIAEHGRTNSTKLNQFFKALPSLPIQGVIAAGGSALTYDGETIDLLGLNNVQIAHAKKDKNKDALKNHASFNKDIFFELQPDVFWYSGWYKSNFLGLDEIKGNEKLDVMLFIKEVFLHIDEDERFKNRYSVVVLKNKQQQEAVKIVASNRFLESLNPAIFEYYSIPINYVNE